MSELSPCPFCQRHVRVEEIVCPFCASALPARARTAPMAAPRTRLSRAALFAAGATLMGIGAASCDSTKTICATDPCTGVGGNTGTAGAGGSGGSGGSGGTTGQAGSDAGPGNDGPVAIYSAAFPPSTSKS